MHKVTLNFQPSYVGMQQSLITDPGNLCPLPGFWAPTIIWYTHKLMKTPNTHTNHIYNKKDTSFKNVFIIKAVWRLHNLHIFVMEFDFLKLHFTEIK